MIASRLAGLPGPLDGVTTALNDPAETMRNAEHARNLGMGGKLCIHPRQIDPVLAAFAPTPSEIDWAKRVLASGSGAVQGDGVLVDEPVRQRAALADPCRSRTRPHSLFCKWPPSLTL